MFEREVLTCCSLGLAPGRASELEDEFEREFIAGCLTHTDVKASSTSDGCGERLFQVVVKPCGEVVTDCSLGLAVSFIFLEPCREVVTECSLGFAVSFIFLEPCRVHAYSEVDQEVHH